MSPAERRDAEADCSRLVFAYANLTDAGAWRELADLFTIDGRLSRPSAPDAWIEGREAIFAAFGARPARKARHICSNVVIDVIGHDAAQGECALALFAEGALPKAGSYHDRFVRVADGWKFAERRGSMAF